MVQVMIDNNNQDSGARFSALRNCLWVLGESGWQRRKRDAALLMEPVIFTGRGGCWVGVGLGRAQWQMACLCGKAQFISMKLVTWCKKKWPLGVDSNVLTSFFDKQG